MGALSIAIVLVLACVAVDAKRPKWHQLEGYTFEKYQKDFRKAYASTKEVSHRRQVFEATLESVRTHNARQGVTYKKGINQFSDMTQEERLRLNGAKRHELAGLAKTLDAKHLRAHKAGPKMVSFPPSVDYRNSLPPVLTAVKDQGQCGSCWAHGSTEQMETYSAMATGQLFVLSQGQINQCAPNPNDCGGTGGCGGSIAELAYAYATENNGLAQVWTYPYTSYWGVTGNCSYSTKLTPPMATFTGYVRVEKNSQEAVMQALVETGPLAVNVDASHWFEYESGIFSGCDYAKNITIDHVVQLVGYGHDEGLNLDYWVIRNSWNAGYGEEGFIRLLRTNTASCGWDTPSNQGTGCNGDPSAFWACGECGILLDTSYPIAGPNP